MSILIYFIIFYILLGVSMMKPFEKAGIAPMKALIPGVAAVEWCKIIGRKPMYALLLLVPIVNIFIFCGMAVDMMRSFGRFSFKDAALAVIYAPLAFFGLRDEKTTYKGPVIEQEQAYFHELETATKSQDKSALRRLNADNPYKKGALREWTEAIVFAVFAAAFIRMFLIEAYVIPTSSMEGSLKVGDFLFVSKAHYGIRTPLTVIQFPLVHNHFSQSGVLNRESYLEKPSLPYNRLPAIDNIERNDPVVFNVPIGDSIILAPERSWDIYQLRRSADPKHQGYLKTKEVISRPIDKKDHYIKRCLAIAGDTLQIKNNQVFVNGKQAANPAGMQFFYRFDKPVSMSKLDDLGVNLQEGGQGGAFLNQKQLETVKSWGVNATIYEPQAIPKLMFPNDGLHDNWTPANYGPIWMPKAGATTVLTPQNINFYERIIRVYEGNTLDIKGDTYIINGQETTSYTFQKDYYWMMGDNRHNSEDSRFWGYVPEDHIVGKPLFIWFSLKNGNLRDGIRWNRVFSSAQKF